MTAGLKMITGVCKVDYEAQIGLLDSISEGVMVRRDNQLLYVNKAAVKMLGLDSKDQLDYTMPVMEWVHPDDRTIVEDMYQKRVAGIASPAAYDVRIVNARGALVWVTNKNWVLSWQGEPAVAATLTDITLQKKSTDSERFSRYLFRNIFDVTPEFMLLFSMKTNEVRDVNPAFLNIFGRRRDDVIGHPVNQLDIISDPTFHHRFVEELKTTSYLSDIPVAMKIRGGLIRHFRIFARKIEGAEETYLLTTGRDVTDEISHSRELQRNRDEAELSNRTKSEFLANMSHELRTPLNAILGFSELIRDQITGPSAVDKYSEYAADIHKSGSHLLSIINDILDLSKVEAGRLEAHLEWLDPVACLKMCLRLINQRAFESGITIETDFDKSIRVEADERLLKQIGLNLLSNAVKFTEAGGIVTVAMARSSEGGAYLSVSDTGIGMTDEEIDVAKRPFGQVDSSLSRRQEGSGLGLPLVAAFAEKLRCSIKIESTPDVGTCIRVFFPSEKVRISSTDDHTVSAQ